MNFLCQRAESGAPSAMLAAMRCAVDSTSASGTARLTRPEPERVLGPEDLPEEQDLQHGVGAELGDERRKLVRRLDEAEPLDRHSEAARGAADPQIAHDRDPEPPTHAVALDEGDGGVAAGAHRVERRPEDPGVDPTPSLVDPPRRELADVRPGAERPPAGPAQEHAAHRRIGVELRHRVLEPQRNLDAERVSPRRRVDDDGRDRAVPRHPDPRRVRSVAGCRRSRPRGGRPRRLRRLVRHRLFPSFLDFAQGSDCTHTRLGTLGVLRAQASCPRRLA